MCRYAISGPYKPHYACFGCRKMFRPAAREDLPDFDRSPYGKYRLVKCPNCGEPMHDMGLDFKAPRQHDVRQWRKVEMLHQHGYNWRSCGCGGGPRVRTLAEVKPFLQEMKQSAEEIANAHRREEKRKAQEAKKNARRKPKPIRWEFYP